MLDVRGLRKAFGSSIALEDSSFFVPKGICYGLLGPNGAGKTTAISIITGTLDADSGTVTLDGESVSTNNLRIKKRIGFVPQDLALYEELNSVDNLRFFGALYGLFGDELEKRVEFGLEVAGLADRRRGAVRDFSGGMKRRLNIASALLHNPDFIVLDEPTVGVDPQSRNLIFEALEALLAEGKTLLYTTHYMEEAERLCQRLAIMDNGKIIAEGSREDLHKLVPTKAVITVEAAEGTTVPPNIPGACNTLVEGHRVTFELEDLKSGLIPALASFAAIEQVHTEQATLEQVFLHLTGRSLRD